MQLQLWQSLLGRLLRLMSPHCKQIKVQLYLGGPSYSHLRQL